MNSNLTYTITVTNNGPNQATGLQLTDMLSPLVSFVSASGGCTDNCGTVTCGIGTLNAAGSTTRTITVLVVAGGQIVNTVGVAGQEFDPTLSNNSNVLTIAGSAGLASLNVTPASIESGTTATGMVTLTAAAPAGDAVVNLTSSNTSAARVPVNVRVLAGQTSRTFTITAQAVSTPTDLSVSATYLGVTRSQPLRVTPPVILSNLAISPSSVGGGASTTGTVTLTYQAPSGGAVVSLSSNNPTVASVPVPANVTVPAGQTTRTFPITTTQVTVSTLVNISATFRTVTKTAQLTVRPTSLAGVNVNPDRVVGGASTTGTVTLDGGAPSGASVALWSSSQSVAPVPANVPILAGASSANFTVTTIPVASAVQVTITATYLGETKTALLTVQPPPPVSGELSENNAAAWGSFASDLATTSLSNNTALVKVGLRSVKFVTASGFDTGVTYPAAGSANWNLSAQTHLVFWAFTINDTPNGFQGSQPYVLLKSQAGSFRYDPTGLLLGRYGWHLIQIPLAGDPQWARTTNGAPSLTDIDQLEIHHDTWDAGFTIYYDGVEFVNALPPVVSPPTADMTEGNASAWGAFNSDPTTSAATMTNDSTTTVIGSQSVKFATGAPFATGVHHPTAGSNRWNLTGKTHLNFWAYAVNGNSGGFQGKQPIVILTSPNGSYRYTPSSVLMSINAWRLYQIPLAGDAVWTRTFIGSPTLSNVAQLEIHQDTFGAGFHIFYDGVVFATASPPIVSSISPSDGLTSGGTVVTINGSGFVATPTVRFGALAAASVTWVNSTQIRATTPPQAAGAVDVTVTNPDGQSSMLVGGYTYRPPIKNARFIGQNVPTTVNAAGLFTATITFENNGEVPWTYADNYRLGSVVLGDPWGARLLLDPGQTVQPGGSKTFSISVPAPYAAGTYSFRWQMVHELVAWFGEMSPPTTVTVLPVGLHFWGIAPCRVFDTRNPNGPDGGPAIPVNTTRNFLIRGACGQIPATAKAVAATVAVLAQSTDGHLSVFPANLGGVATSVVNFRANRIRANNGTFTLDQLGRLSVSAGLGGGSLHVFLDVTGYYE